MQATRSSANQVPAAPTGPLEALKQSGGRVLLEWGPTRSAAGEANIKNLILERLEENRGRWEILATLGPNKRSYMVDRVSSDVTTYYRLSAENVYGKGQPIQTSISYTSTPSGRIILISCY